MELVKGVGGLPQKRLSEQQAQEVRAGLLENAI